MRLLFLTNEFPNPLEPTKAVFNLELARALVQRQELRVISPIAWVDEWRGRRQNPERCLERLQVIDGIEVHYPRYYYPPRILRRFYSWFLWHSVRATVQRVLESYQPDLILGYWAHPDGAAAVRVARLVGVPAVIMVGGTDVLMYTRQRGRRACIHRVLQNADAVVATSQDLTSKVIELGVLAEKVHVVYRGVSRSLFSPGDRIEARRRLAIPLEGKMLIWVGRMVPLKGLDVLLEACVALRQRGVDFHLYLLGDGPLRKSLEGESIGRGLSMAVSILGPVPHERLPDWYRAADLTVLPSRSEGVPNVLRESLACGTPFVASRVGGIPEIADGSSGRLVPPDNSSALAEAIAQALSEREPAAHPAAYPATWPESAESLLRVLRPLVPSSGNGETPGLTRHTISRGRPELVPRQRRYRQWLRRSLAAMLPRRLFLASGPSGTRSVCLTFDDGPHPDHTPAVLDVLKKYTVPATFFVIGQKAERYPDLIRRMSDEGHAVGNHTFSHGEPDLTSAKKLLAEIGRTREVLTRLLGQAPALFRPPKGKLTARKLWQLWRAGQTVVLWNADPRDYACSSTEQVRTWFHQRPLRGGDVVLMHDDRPHAARVLPELIAEAMTRGLSFITASELTRA